MKQKVALVLSGGGARGLAHIGVIEELEQQGYEISSISGTSMGALVGGVYAIGKMQEFKNWVYSLHKIDVFKLIDFTFSAQGLIKGDRILKKMKEFIPDVDIEELKINYAAVATDIINDKEYVFKSGDIFEAIRASISIPTVFVPVKKENSLLVDGGVTNNIPIKHVKRIDNDILVVVHVNADVPVHKLNLSFKEKEVKESTYLKKIKHFQKQFNKLKLKQSNRKLGYFNLINKTIGLMSNQLSELILKVYHPNILINVSRKTCGLFDFYRAEELVEIGRKAARESLQKFNN
jgi:NTE family protein